MNYSKILLCIYFFTISPQFLSAADNPYAVPTFECIGLYWKTEEGAEEILCNVNYRVKDSDKWKKGIPLWFDSRNNEYRGSIVHLKPGSDYEIKLSISDDNYKILNCRTWSEDFPVAKKIAVFHTSKTLVIDQSGTPEGYHLYTVPGWEASSINANNKHDHCIVVKGSYVIIRNLGLHGARIHAIVLEEGVHDVVIDGCEFALWGRVDKDGWGRNYDSAIYSKAKDLKRRIIQNNVFLRARSKSNNWRQSRPRPGKREPNHPEGPQVVCFWDSQGNHVIRHNLITGDDFNDIFGAGKNFSERGFPNHDSDIYGNYLESCWDDAIESEGANCNVRIWNNYMDKCLAGVACAGTSKGPLYVWRNVICRTHIAPDEWNGGFLKTSDKASGGRIYVFHNTILNSPYKVPVYSKGTKTPINGPRIGLGWGGPMVNVTSRNNILDATSMSFRDRTNNPLNDFDYDLYTGQLPDKRHQKHGIKGKPVYGDNFKISGEYLTINLKPGSPGQDAGIRIPNFNDDYLGKAPDMGAHECGHKTLYFGIKQRHRNKTN